MRNASLLFASLLLLAPSVSWAQQAAAQQPKFAVAWRQMVGATGNNLLFSQQSGADRWAPGSTYYKHKDVEGVESVTRYVRCTDFQPSEAAISLKLGQKRDVSLAFTPQGAAKRYVDRGITTSNNRVATARRLSGGVIQITAVGLGQCTLTLHHPEAGYRQLSVSVQPDEQAVEATVDSLLSLLTQDEKLSLIGGTNWYYTKPVDRVDIPSLRMCDGPAGVGGGIGPSTAYPTGISLAATWNRQLANRYGVSLGHDSRARGLQFILGPAVNIVRAPLCGRNFEYMGEDPYLSSQTTIQYINGVQSQGVSTVVKHFIANNSDYDRDHISNDIDERTLHEIYLPAFRAAVQEGNTGGVMSSYNLLNGTYTTHSKPLLTYILRTQWGYKGILMSDWGSTHNGLAAAQAGLDLEMASADHMTPDSMKMFLAQGKITQETIDTKVRHILHTLVGMGFLHGKQQITSIPLDDATSDSTALAVARECVVLLKNRDNILPIDTSTVHHIVVTGKNATGYVHGGGSGGVNPTHYVDVYHGLQALGDKMGVKVEYCDDLYFLPTIIFTDNTLSQKGFTANYYNGTDPTGTPVATRTETKIRYIWNGMSPGVGSLGTENYSVSWKGVLCSPETATYTFTLGGDDAYRLYIDGKAVIDEWEPRAYHNTTYNLRLMANEHHNIEVQYYQQGGDARVDFIWKKQGDNTDYMADYLRQADLVVACIGQNSVTEGEGHDRDFNLDSDDNALLTTVRKSGRPLVALLNGGASMAVAPWEVSAKGILWAGYAGQEAGTAVAEVLFGKVNPSGHLPVTFERRWEDNPTYNSYHDPDGDKHVRYTEGIFMGYRGYDHLGRTVQYPFGYGLSYTTFDLADMQVGQLQSDTTLTVTCQLTNTGDRAGAQVVQAYVGRQGGDVEHPVRELRQYAKVFLQPGESRRVTLTLPRSSFTYYSVDKHDFVYDPGQYTIELGFSSRDIKGSQAVTIR